MPKKRPSPRHSLLNLAPLELDCMNTLWPMGEATVREIRERLAERRPRAYTTIMTIMDRLAHKGVVERRKAGRAYVYRANLGAAEARAQAVAQIVKNYFGGSEEALLTQLGAKTATTFSRAAAAGAEAAPEPGPATGRTSDPAPAPISNSAMPENKTEL